MNKNDSPARAICDFVNRPVTQKEFEAFKAECDARDNRIEARLERIEAAIRLRRSRLSKDDRRRDRLR